MIGASGPGRTIGHLSRPLVRAFGHLLEKPGDWHTPGQLITAAQVSRSTVYMRLADLAAMGAVRTRRRDDMREFQLHPNWEDCPTARELAARWRLAQAGPEAPAGPS